MLDDSGLSPPPRRPRRALPRADGREVAAVFAGGALGTLARAALAEAFPHSPTAWPWPTFAVNIVAAFLLGYFVTRLQERLPLSAYRRPVLGTGFCGAFTTFSNMQVQLVTMLDGAREGLALAYGESRIVLGYGSVKLGNLFAR